MSTRKSSASPKASPKPANPKSNGNKNQSHTHISKQKQPRQPPRSHNEPSTKRSGPRDPRAPSSPPGCLFLGEPSGPAVPGPGEGGGGLPTFWSHRPGYEAGGAPSMAHAGAGSHQGQRTRGGSRQQHPGWEEQELGNILQLHPGSCSPPRLLLLPHHHEEGRFAPASRRSQRAESKQR